MDPPDSGFSQPELDASYKLNSTGVQEQDLGVLIDLTNIFLNSCFGDNLLPADLIDKFEDDYLEVILDNIQPILLQHVGFYMAIVFGVLISALMPFVALIYCCCVCCSSSNKKHSKQTYNRICTTAYGFFLFICIVFAYLSCVWFFLGSASFQKGVEKLPQFIDDCSQDGLLYLENTSKEISYLLDDNFDETAVMVDGKINDILSNFSQVLDNELKNMEFEEIRENATQFADILNGFNDIVPDISNLNTKISNICQPPLLPICDLGNTLSQYLNPDPSVDTTILSEITTQLENFPNFIEELKNQLENCTGDISAKVIDVKAALNTQRETIINGLDQIKTETAKLNIDKTLKDIYNYFKDYYMIPLKVLGSLLIVILSLLFISMAAGCMFKPGEKIAFAASRTNKITIGLFLTLGLVFFLTTAGFFIVGALSSKVFCTTLQDPTNSDILVLADDVINNIVEGIYSNLAGEDVTSNLKIEDIISGLKNGDPIYPLLDLNQIYDVQELQTNWKVAYEITDLVVNILAQLDDQLNSIITKIPVLPAQIIDKTMEADEMLGSIVSALRDANNTTPETDETLEILGDMRLLINKIETTFENVTNGSNFFIYDKAQDLNIMLQNATHYLQTDGKNVIKLFLNDSIENCLGLIDSYLIFAVDSFDNTIGSTYPIGQIINATDLVLCQNIVDHFNTVWSGLGLCCLIILGPVAILVRILRPRYETKKTNCKDIIEDPNLFNINFTNSDQQIVARATTLPKTIL